MLLYKRFSRRVELPPGNIAIKSGHQLHLHEADALRIAYQNGLPVPKVHEVGESNGRQFIKMDYIEGTSLDKRWPKLSTAEKESVALQLREIIDQMRRIPPPSPTFIGGCD